MEHYETMLDFDGSEVVFSGDKKVGRIDICNGQFWAFNYEGEHKPGKILGKDLTRKQAIGLVIENIK